MATKRRGGGRKKKTSPPTAPASREKVTAQGRAHKETGVRLSDALGLALLKASKERDVSMETIARLAMIAFARRRGIELAGGGDSRPPRIDAAAAIKSKASQARKLWIKVPVAWGPGIKQILDGEPAVLYVSHLWRFAIQEECSAFLSAA